MEPWVNTLVTIVVTLLASTGFWTFIMKRIDKKDVRTQMLVGLGHDRIIFLGKQYIKRGYITADEYENLSQYLYEPYSRMGGNGSAKRIMQEVDRLPIKGDAL